MSIETHGSSETILVVDDEAGIRSSVRGILADEGYRVLEAEDGRGALQLIAAERPRLVIVDIWMPEMDGIELLRRIRDSDPMTPVIVISGHGNIETAVTATKLGAFDFIEKPFSLDGLLHVVDRALESHPDGARGAGDGVTDVLVPGVVAPLST